ncbi:MULTISPECIES: hypothetical protein [Exiguobacterium]|uniref:Uncharacterized protein n=1 Tax=Exiguobacterium aurantiacum TaxID=33987 RepID=A0A377FR49_9BACL|nr:MULTISPECIES: hypothetical protein [Exiguobacterium]STO06946.1 Uncharacterised protein [Exiguobacterium aurantiacum]
MPKFYWLGTFASGVLLLSIGEAAAVPRILPYILMAVGAIGFIIQTGYEQKRRR